MYFEANAGQADEETLFIARRSNLTLYLTQAGVRFSLGPQGERSLSMGVEGGNPSPLVEGVNPLQGKVNYLMGNDPSEWRTGVPTFGRVRYGDVYPGIDLVFHGDGGGLEYDFVVSPGADPSTIELAFRGARSLKVTDNGALEIAMEGGVVRQEKPVIYQDRAGKRRLVQGGYALGPDGKVGFRIGTYDPKRSLVIDPVIGYSTYLGGSGEDTATGIAVDKAGNAYVTGFTKSLDFPTEKALGPEPEVCLHPNVGCRDGFVARLSADGSGLVYSTYIGGIRDDNPQSIRVDPTGHALVAGYTFSPDFPTTPAFQPAMRGLNDAFIFKLSSDGTRLIFSTFLGGSGFAERAFGVDFDPLGGIYVTGDTDSVDFPTTPLAVQPTVRSVTDCDPRPTSFNRCPDAFVAKLSPDGLRLEYSTYLGGFGTDSGFAVAAASLAGGIHAFIAGATQSSDDASTAIDESFPTTAGSLQRNPGPGFIAQINPSGSALVYSSYFPSIVSTLAVDDTGSAYAAGAAGSGLPVTAGAFQVGHAGSADAYVAKLAPGGGALDYATYFGGSGSDGASRIAIDASGAAYISGGTDSADLPGAGTALGAGDGFVAKVSPDGASLGFAMYLGGSGGDSAVGVALDGAGGIYVAATVGSSDAPVASSAFQPYNFDVSVFVAKIVAPEGDIPLVTKLSPKTGPGGVEIRIEGERLANATAVLFGGVPAARFTTISDHEIRAIAPRLVEGTIAEVRISTPAGQSPVGAQATYRYSAGTWVSGDHLPSGRYHHRATRLKDGRILVTGGCVVVDRLDTRNWECTPGPDSNTDSATSEVLLFDPAAGNVGSWVPGQSMGNSRYGHSATLLKDGRVLVAGGRVASFGVLSVLDTVEIFDPSEGSGRGTWRATGSMLRRRAFHTATLLPDGRVLVIGTEEGDQARRTAEIYDPGTGTWTATSPPTHGWGGHTATLLRDGTVLVAGGFEGPTLTDLYDYRSNSWRASGALNVARNRHGAVLLDTGAVLLTGGGDSGGTITWSASEIYEPAMESWRPAGSLNLPRLAFSMLKLADGRVMAVGGCTLMTVSQCIRSTNTTEIFDPALQDGTGAWRLSGSISSFRRSPTATLLLGDDRPFDDASARAQATKCASLCGGVLVAGGADPSGPSRATDIFIPAPTVDSVAPGAGGSRGEDIVTVSGTGLTGAKSIIFGDGSEVACGDGPQRCRVDSFFKATVAPPPHPSGLVDVYVHTPRGFSYPSPGAVYRYLVSQAPGRVLGLSATALSSSTVELSFRAPSSDGGFDPPAGRYEIRRSAQPLTEANFDAGADVCGGECRFQPGSVGETLKRTVDGLAPGLTHHFAVRALNEAGLKGPVSESVSAATLAAPVGPGPGGGTSDSVIPLPPAGPVSGSDGSCPAAQQAPGRVVLPSGRYSLVGFPAGTVVPSDSPLYGWFDQGSGGSYTSQPGGSAAQGGRGYWAWFACPRETNLTGPGQSSLEVSLGARRASMLGNPSGSGPVQVTGHDFAARWDPSLNNGRGGYHISGYRQAQTLSVGEGLWVYTARATTIKISG